MDPLSITASVIAVVQLCGATANTLNNIREACKSFPGRLHALQEEVADLKEVLQAVTSLDNDRAGSQRPTAHLHNVLEHATRKLTELQQMLLALASVAKSSKIRLVQANAWRKVQGRLKQLQAEIKAIKTNLNILLGASNSRDMMTVRLQAQAILTKSAHQIQQHRDQHGDLTTKLDLQHDSLDASIAHLQEHIDDRLKRVEQTLKDQGTRLYENQTIQIGSEMAGDAARRARAMRDVRRDKREQSPGALNDAVGIRFTRMVGVCLRRCPCSCHRPQKGSTSSTVDRWLGRLSFELVGFPIISVGCDDQECKRSQYPQANLEYWFPLGLFWSQIVRLRMGYEPNIGPQVQLHVLRRVPDSSPAIDFAMKGNVEGLLDLFRKGLASPRDVSSTRGYTLLRWAMYAKQYQTCKFLLHSGADPDYRPISRHDNSPRNKANDFILQGGLSKEAEEIYRQIAAGVEYVDEQAFTLLHKSVLGLTFRHLEDVVAECPNDIETADAMGRTPLSWAACRGDHRSIVLLLAHGADPNSVDAQSSGPVSNAADRGHTTCVRLLLEAGGDPDPVRHSIQKGSPLNCASRNAEDPLLIKTLLDFGADIEARGVDGITPLIHVARRDNLSFAQVLLDYGADINAMTSAQQTPLTMSITHNSHKVLHLLLGRWHEYSECPRLQGPHLLSLVATFADKETMRMLATTDHLKAAHDPSYKAQDYIKAVKSRYDADEVLVAGFKELLEVIEFRSATEASEGETLGHECPTRRSSVVFASGSPDITKNDDDFDDIDQFEDALESIAR